MEGEAVNISNIEKKIREEFNNVKDRFKEGAENVSEKFSDIEKKYKPKAKSGFQDFLDTLGNILVKFFKIIGKLIGVLIIIISASVLILFILGIFSIGSFSIIGFKEGYELTSFYDRFCASRMVISNLFISAGWLPIFNPIYARVTYLVQ